MFITEKDVVLEFCQFILNMYLDLMLIKSLPGVTNVFVFCET